VLVELFVPNPTFGNFRILTLLQLSRPLSPIRSNETLGAHKLAGILRIRTAMAICRVLSCSPNLELAQLRAAVLKTADCDVVCPVSQKDAMDLMKEEKFDALIICYEYTEEAGQEICDAFKHSYPHGKILVLRKSHHDSACPDEPNTIHALDGPGALIRAVLA
jgi:CheY-like chemotaxis protein